jgi:hypothetical protein
LFDRGNYLKTYADKEVDSTSILRVRTARLRKWFWGIRDYGGRRFQLYMIMAGGFIARRFYVVSA